MFCEVIRNCCSLTTLSLLRDSAIGSEKWHFKYPAGVPLEEKDRFPGTPIPKDGTIIPSDAPGFGLEIKKEWFPDFFS